MAVDEACDRLVPNSIASLGVFPARFSARLLSGAVNHSIDNSERPCDCTVNDSHDGVSFSSVSSSESESSNQHPYLDFGISLNASSKDSCLDLA